MSGDSAAVLWQYVCLARVATARKAGSLKPQSRRKSRLWIGREAVITNESASRLIKWA
jgi:hypothetical protein